MRCSPKDRDDVVRVMTHDSVRNSIVDDSVRGRDHIAANADKLLKDISIYVLRPAPSVILSFIPKNKITYEVHIASIPRKREGGVRDAAYAAVVWMLENTPCRKVIATIPTSNPRAIEFVERCGMIEEGLIRQSFQKSGKIYNQKIFGLTAEEILWQQQ